MAEKSKRPKRAKEEADTGAKSERRGFGEYFKLGFLRAGAKVGLIEKHQIEPNFDRNITLIEKYHKAILHSYTGCEAMMQPNPTLYNDHKVNEPTLNDNTHMKLGIYLEYMKDVGLVDLRVKEGRQLISFHSEHEKKTLNSLLDLLKTLSNSEREFREQTLKYTKNTIDFLCTFSNEFAVDRQNLKEHLLAMDEFSMQVRRAKTNDELQRVGPKYEEAVNEYNRRSIGITDFWIYNYPKFNYLHQRDQVKFHMSRVLYHKEMARLIREWLSKNDFEKAAESARTAEMSSMSKSAEPSTAT